MLKTGIARLISDIIEIARSKKLEGFLVTMNMKKALIH